MKILDSIFRFIRAIEVSTWVFLGILLGAICLCLSPVLFHSGWPLNHEYEQFYFRTYVWAEHFRMGDFFPVWSSSDANDFGTPMPLYYQKLFYTLSAILFIVTSHIKLSIVLTIGILMVLGAMGMRTIVGLLTKNVFIMICLPVVFLFSNYVFTDWLVRGAMAEFAAMMIIPWLIWWSLNLIRNDKFSPWIAPIYIALFYAHNAIALVATLLPVAAFCIYVLGHRRELFRVFLSWRKIVISFVVVVLFILPTLVLQYMMGNDYNPNEKINDGYQIQNQFKDISSYILDPAHVWLDGSMSYTVSIGLVVTILLLAMICLCVVLIFKKIINKKVLLGATPVFLVLILAVYLFMQTTLSMPMYDTVKVLSYIQFPWRMLVIITPLLLVLLTYLFIQVPFKKRYIKLGSGIIIFWSFLCVTTSPIFFSNHLVYQPTNAYAPVFYEGGEYTPKTYNKAGVVIKGPEMMNLYASLDDVVGSVCTITKVTSKFEDPDRLYAASCDKSTVAALPLSYSRYTRAWVDGGEVLPIKSRTDPRLFISLRSGDSKIVTRDPTLVTIMEHALSF